MIPLAAGSATAEVLTSLFIVLLAAKLGDELFRRMRQPTIVGEILAGLLVGPSVLGLVEPDEVLEVFAELGVVFLLFWVGLETRLSELREVGATAVSVGVLGVAVPFAGGIGLGLALGESTGTTLFLASALVATSVGITSAVLLDLGVLERPTSRTILGAAIVDDILALLLVAVAAGVAAEGGVDIGSIAITAAVALAFVAFVGDHGRGRDEVRGRVHRRTANGSSRRDVRGRRHGAARRGRDHRRRDRQRGTIDGELFAVLVAMSVLTTLVVPPVLRRLA